MEKEKAIYDLNAKMRMKISILSNQDIKNALLGVFILNQGIAVTSMKTPSIVSLEKNKICVLELEVDLERIAPGKYTTKLVLSKQNEMGHVEYYDVLMNTYSFEIVQPHNWMHNRPWSIHNNGFLVSQDLKLLKQFNTSEDYK